MEKLKVEDIKFVSLQDTSLKFRNDFQRRYGVSLRYYKNQFAVHIWEHFYSTDEATQLIKAFKERFVNENVTYSYGNSEIYGETQFKVNQVFDLDCPFFSGKNIKVYF